ncbi:tRNA (guanine-N7-)-methyltransferase [Sediminihabitans luteus]|uniref:tRNA (guanine-N(7)-)-methyltransferase n=1 Tax=Sediminihabitans luteus TaxID=1138585 RepID=A0A2M9CY76_9CELL|nr:tRNA (guanosine(46)-N7)-methyltransferase TrmB [Sediminihabitans luteus]PJJ76886.1 tRNA (guanine-N7-)-methyltransferase [Sediminihabitans luteus]GII99527.1 tRNA (guanine-N(7)-)-methyltransferase [Sediminihabitans luteus]
MPENVESLPSLVPDAARPGEPPVGAADQPAFRTTPVSFVRRSGRMNVRQQEAWDTRRDEFVVEVPRLAARTSVDPRWSFDPEASFGRRAPLVVEVGSGQGEAVVAAAAATPERDFLALEVYTPGLGQTVYRSIRAGLTNVRLMQANAPEVLEHALAPGSVDELWVFFPDPWHKARHTKRRLVAPPFVELAARALRPGGTWRLATDWAEYAEQMIEVVEASSAFTNAHGPGAHAPRFEGRVLTGFENKAAKAGRDVVDLTYVRS